MSWSYSSWIYNYLCNQYLSPLTLWIQIPLRRGVLYATSCDKVCQCLVADRWFSPGTLISSNNKTDRHDITEILLKVALNTITLTLFQVHISLSSISYLIQIHYCIGHIFAKGTYIFVYWDYCPKVYTRGVWKSRDNLIFKELNQVGPWFLFRKKNLQKFHSILLWYDINFIFILN